MNSLTSEFVFSAPAYLYLISHGKVRSDSKMKALYNAIVTDGILRVKEIIKEIDYPMMISILFNAFTEGTYGDFIAEANNFGFDRVYSDSGGLQIVSRGMTANTEAKQSVYKVQSRTDLAMCFDEIPVRNERVASRLAYSDRVFIHDDLVKCAKMTAENVIEQIDAFRKFNSKAKVFFIVQGNSISDMCEWFDVAVRTIPEDYWDGVGGLAIGGTCLGFGQREDVEKIAVYRKLREEFGTEYTKKHLHILGVGATSRFAPIIILRNTGFIPPDTHISYDSSSLSMAYMYGNFIGKDGEFKRDTPNWEDTFQTYYNLVSPVLLDHGYTQKEMDDYYPMILQDMLYHSKIYANHPDDRLRIVHQSVRVLINIYQIINFVKALHTTYDNWDKTNDAIGMLKIVKDLDSFFAWEKEYAAKVPSKRITRKVMTEIERQLEVPPLTGKAPARPPRTISKASLVQFMEDL